MKPLSIARAASWFFDLLGVGGLVILLCGIESAFGVEIAMIVLGTVMLVAAILFCRHQ